MSLDLDKKPWLRALSLVKTWLRALITFKTSAKCLEYGKNLTMRLDNVLAMCLDYKQHLG